LLLGNLLLLLAPQLAIAGDRPVKSSDKQGALSPQPEPQPVHHAPGRVRPQPASSPQPSGKSSNDDGDDDDGAEVASGIAEACCAGVIGGIASGSGARSPADVPPPPPEPELEPTPTVENQGGGGAPPQREAGSGANTVDGFDVDAAREAVKAAEASAREACGWLDHDVHARLVFAPSGKVTHVVVEPAPADETYRGCLDAELRTITVPPFSGDPASVEKTLRLGIDPSPDG
jgi:hypothetical protein